MKTLSLCLALLIGTAAVATAASPTQPSPSRQRTETRTPDSPTYAQHPAVQRFAADVAERRGWSAEWVEQQVSQARRIKAVQQLMMPPPAATSRNWQAYRARFVEPVRLRAGAQFWQTHERTLALAEERWGVPAEIVVAIVGVETLYGRHLGNFRVLDALATLSFDFPEGRRDRSAYFRSELEELLALGRRTGVDIATMRGSYAGAWGLPQFMPGSINRFAVDFDEDGRVDLMHSAADVIGSVANYMAAHGWQRGLPTHHSLTPPTDSAALRTLLEPDILPSFTAVQLTSLGAALGESARDQPGLMAVVELPNGTSPPDYVAGTANFYAITRYNWSSFYAMAVIELGSALAEQRRLR